LANIESANFEDTKEKICEARYFLDGMEKNQGDLKPFRYNLSAFVSAFFSITSFLCKELSHHRGFKEWYESDLRPWMEGDGKMRLLYKSRRTTVHIHRIPTRKNATVHLPSIGSGNKVSAEHKWYFDLYEEIQGIPDIDNLIKIDVTTICRTCLNELEHRLSLFDAKLLKSIC
jgi:hypothetical protein